MNEGDIEKYLEDRLKMFKLTRGVALEKHHCVACNLCNGERMVRALQGVLEVDPVYADSDGVQELDREDVLEAVGRALSMGGEGDE